MRAIVHGHTDSGESRPLRFGLTWRHQAPEGRVESTYEPSRGLRVGTRIAYNLFVFSRVKEERNRAKVLYVFFAHTRG